MALATMTIDPNAFSTGEQIRDALVALSDAERLIVITRPSTGKHKAYAMHRTADGKLEIEYDDVAES